MKLNHYIIPYTKINSKQIKDWNIWPETMKILEGNSGGKLLDTGFGNDFWNLTPQEKAKINKWDYIKMISFCTAKEASNRIKRQSTKQEKIFANHVSDIGLTSKIHKELL